MAVKDLLPVLIPGCLVQFFVQAFFLRHCWRNKKLTKKQKALYLVAIVVFNIPAAAYYLFATREPEEAVLQEEQDDLVADSQVRQGIFVLLLVAYEIFALRVLADNLGTARFSYLSILLGTCFVVMIVHGLLMQKTTLTMHYLLSALQLILIFPVEYLNRAYDAPFMILAVVAALINAVPLPQAKKVSLAALVLYTILLIAKVTIKNEFLDRGAAVGYIYANFLVFVLVFAAFYSLHKQFFTTRQLAKALKRLQEQALQLQKMSVIEERNRIAGEIHDTVGHTLTSALITLEAGEALFANDATAALDKFTLAKEQVKRGLAEIRNSVKAIRAGDEDDFLSRLAQLVQEIKRHTGLQVTQIVDLKSKLLPIQQRVLLQTIKECATNSIKHGKGTELDLLLQEHQGVIRLTVSDNGLGAEEVKFGFGLTIMQERVQSLGGTLDIETAAREGFTVNVTLPVGEEAGGKKN